MRAVLVTALLCFGVPAAAETAHTPVFSTGDAFDEQTGEALYQGICQGCHMPNGQGAAGAGRYPALAKNPKLEASGYPVTMVLKGFNGMPTFADRLTDAQIAQVVNYVRTHFGNSYADAVKPEDVKASRDAK